MNFGAQSGLLAAVVSIAVTISVLLRTERGPLSTLFTFFAANLFFHYLASFLAEIAESALWLHADLIAASLLPVSANMFFGYFLWREPELPKRYTKLLAVCSGAALIMLFLPWSRYQLTKALVLSYCFAGLYLCAWLMLVRYRELKSRREQTRLRYLLLFHSVAVTLVLLGTFPGPLGFLRIWGNLVSIFFLYFVSQALLKYRLLDLQELLGRTFVLTGVAGVLTGVFGVLVLLSGGQPSVSLLQTFVAAMVILILFEPLRDQIEVGTRRLFFRHRYEISRKLEVLRREVAGILDLEQMVRRLLDDPYENLRLTHVSVYLQEPGAAALRLIDHRGPRPADRLEVVAHRAFFDQLGKTPTAILAETFERQAADHGAPGQAGATSNAEMQRARSLLETLGMLRTGISIPLVSQNEILGLWNLHDENGLETYSAQDLALLMSIGEQAAINIENSRLFERTRERDRLAALGEMSAGLAHEIRNPLGAIKGAAQYLEPASVGEDAAEFLRIIIEEVDRLNGVVNQFLDYARPLKAQHGPADINKVLEHTLKLVRPSIESRPTALAVEVELDPALPLMEASEQQLTQVFLNLINNAIEAMQNGGTLRVRTMHKQSVPAPWRRTGKAQSTVQVEIQDTGEGIPPDKLRNIFVPFFTTKERGTGLGLAISQRIIEGHAGEIRVRSRPGEGSTFTVVLTRHAN